MKTKLLLALLIGNLPGVILFAQTPVASVQTGAWDDVATWDCACVPATGNDVSITAGTIVTTTVSAVCTTIEIWGSLVVDPAVTLTVDGSTNANSFSQDFTIEGTAGVVTNNGILVLDQGAAGGTPLYDSQAGAAFTNNGTFTIDNGGVYTEGGTFVNTGIVNINSASGNSYYIIAIGINNSAGTFNVNSNSVLQNLSSFAGADGIINMNAGSTYDHAQAGEVIPTAVWDITSTCLISGATTAVPTGGLGQSFGNFTWSSVQTAGIRSLAGNLTTVNGNFTLLETGNPSKTFHLATTESYSLTIGGNLILSSAGADILQFATTGTPTVSVGGNVSVITGRIIMGASTAGLTSPVLNIAGNYVHSGGAGNTLSMSGNNNTTGIMNLTGNFNYTSATASLITETGGNGAGSGTINFVGDVSHTFNTGVVNPFINKIQLVVTGGDLVDMSGSTTNLTLASSATVNVNSLTVANTGTLTTGTKTITTSLNSTPSVFTLSAGGTLSTTNVSGVSATVSGAGTETFDPAANYVLGGASTTTGFTGASTTMNDLTTTASAVLGESIVVNGDFLNSSGTFTAGANTITVGDDFTNNGTFTANTSTVSIAGDFSNTGTFNANTGTVVFNGAAAQSVGGNATITFNNINSDNTCLACGVALAQNVNLVGALNINSRTFTTTGFNFTLISNSSGTARIGPITAAGADFVGNITMQRYAPASSPNPDDWRFFGSPVSDATATIADWTDDFFTSGFTGSDDPGNSFVSIYSYDETVSDVMDSGFVAISSSTVTIANGQGFWVYLGPTPTTFDITGAPNKFAVPLPVSFSAGISQDDDGWNMVANPYPCPIDWDAAIGWTKTSMEDAIYVYNSTTQTYAYHCPVDSIPINGNGGTQYIASSQAFWVKASTDFPVPVLDATENVKVADVATDASFLKLAQQPVNLSNYPAAFKDFPVPQSANNVPGRLKLTATGTGYGDEMFIHFNANATNNFDKKYDAWKLINPGSNVPNFSSVINDTTDLAVNGLPALTTDVHIPLRLTVPASGTYKIARDSVLMLPLSSCIVLEDKVTAAMIDLRSVVTYTFTIADTTVAPRFILHIYAPVTKSSSSVSCPFGGNGKAIAKGTGAGPWNYTWKNSAGTVVKTTLGSSTSDTLANCVAGIYSVTITGGACGAVTDTVRVLQPLILGGTLATASVTCFGGNNGTASIIAYGGSPSYSYLWDNGQTTSVAVNLAYGNYSVTITDSKGCTATASVTVGQPLAMSHTVSAAPVSCFSGTNGSASVLTVGGTASYSYVWGNGQTMATATGLSFGTYSVAITDANGCTSSASVTVGQPSILTHTVSQTNVSCYGANDGSASVSMSGGTAPYSFSWSTGTSTTAISNLVQGSYSVLVTDGNGCTASATVTLTQPAAAVVAGYTASSYTVDIALGSDVTFTNSSTGALTYQWNFGDGSALSTSVDPVHTYSAAGTYTVTLISSDAPCADTAYSMVVVINSNPTALPNDPTSSLMNVGYGSGQVYLVFTFGKETEVSVDVYNSLGQQVLSAPSLMVKSERIGLNFPNAASGIYVVVAKTIGARLSEKLIIPIR